jgi:hypothetical protein
MHEVLWLEDDHLRNVVILGSLAYFVHRANVVIRDHSIHVSPATINCIASDHPWITWLGAKDVGSPRAYEESKTVPAGCCCAVRPS